MRSFLGHWPTYGMAVFCTLTYLADIADAQRGRGQRGGDGGWKFVSEKYDANKDGKVSSEEYTRGKDAFAALDKNADGVIDAEDWKVRGNRGRGNSAAPSVGSTAPDFTLTEISDANTKVTLSTFAGNKPVALLFGSCT